MLKPIYIFAQAIPLLSAALLFNQNVMAETVSDTSALQSRTWLLGDWKGQRTALKQEGYDFTFAWVNQSASNLMAVIMMTPIFPMQDNSR